MEQLTIITNQLGNLETIVSNSSAMRLDDEVVPLRVIENGAVVQLPQNMPLTVGAIRNLPAGQHLSQIENYYHLPHHGPLSKRRHRVLRAYGIKRTIAPSEIVDNWE